MIVVKERSNATWNCGDTLPTNKLSTKATVLVYIGDIPKYIPGVFSISTCQMVDPQLRYELMYTQGIIVVASALGWNLP